ATIVKEKLMALLTPVIPRLHIEGSLVDADQIFRGHINKTYVSTVDHFGTQRRFVHQVINHEVFKNPPLMMENIRKVVEHVGSKRSGQLTLVPQADGSSYFQDESGLYWRTYDYVEGTTVYDIVDAPQVAYEAAVTFGQFLDDLSDLDPSDFHITIPDFHNTPVRLQQLNDAIQVGLPERIASANKEIEFVTSVDHLATKLTDVLDMYPETVRVTHNDTKVNNVLFDSE